MTDRQNERMSDSVMREKSTELKKDEAKQNLENCFSGEGRLEITQSRNGNDRVRAFIPDADGDAGWIENNSYVGVFKITQSGQDKYIAERHFPNDIRKTTYFWEFTPETGELLSARQDSEGDTPQFDMPMSADAEQESYFLRLTQDMANTYRFNDYEVDKFRRDRYTFKLEDLK